MFESSQKSNSHQYIVHYCLVDFESAYKFSFGHHCPKAAPEENYKQRHLGMWVHSERCETCETSEIREICEISTSGETSGDSDSFDRSDA